VSLPAGTHRLGPDNATLEVKTKRVGAAAKAGHDLRLEVSSWSATVAASENPAETALELEADPSSLRVVEGTGGMMPLGDDDIASIHQTIDDEVLRRGAIAFRSTRVEEGGDGLAVEGELTLAGETNPIAFDLDVAGDGTLAATAVVTQSKWGMRPYSALFGALKVHDDVEVVLDGHL
jgi:polyisoprenoid-binding protein YceI